VFIFLFLLNILFLDVGCTERGGEIREAVRTVCILFMDC
jgi:hypothetical protein